jgi:hypothetical protein
MSDIIFKLTLTLQKNTFELSINNEGLINADINKNEIIFKDDPYPRVEKLLTEIKRDHIIPFWYDNFEKLVRDQIKESIEYYKLNKK